MLDVSQNHDVISRFAAAYKLEHLRKNALCVKLHHDSISFVALVLKSLMTNNLLKLKIFISIYNPFSVP